MWWCGGVSGVVGLVVWGCGGVSGGGVLVVWGGEGVSGVGVLVTRCYGGIQLLLHSDRFPASGRSS